MSKGNCSRCNMKGNLVDTIVNKGSEDEHHEFHCDNEACGFKYRVLIDNDHDFDIEIIQESRLASQIN